MSAATSHNHAQVNEEKGSEKDFTFELNRHQLEKRAERNGFTAKRGGRYVLDPAEAAIEFGEDVAAKLKTTRDGKTVLWPQPLDDPIDPQGWSSKRKTINFVIACVSAFMTDFTVNIGLAAIYNLAAEFSISPNDVNTLSINWSVLCVGLGAPFFVLACRKCGRLPVLFWSQLLMFGFLIGCTAATSLPVFTAMRCIQAFLAVGPQVIGLFTICDMYPVHEQGSKITIWVSTIDLHARPAAVQLLMRKLLFYRPLPTGRLLPRPPGCLATSPPARAIDGHLPLASSTRPSSSL